MSSETYENSAGNKPKRRWLVPLISVLVLVLGVTSALGLYYYRTTKNALDNVQRSNSLLPNDKNHSASVIDANSGKAINILVLGSDSRGSDQGRSDSMMMAHIPADRKHVYLISFPRDMYVSIPNHGLNKINAAYQYGGSPLAVQTVEELTNSRIQHVALVNFTSFVQLVDNLGGVTVNNPYGGCDSSQHLCWKKGKINLTSYSALHYVRWRHGLPNGDITRAQNQQRVVKAIIAKMLSGGMLTNPTKLSGVIGKVSKNVVVDSAFSTNQMLGLGMNMKIGSSSDLRSITAPISGFGNDPVAGSIDKVDSNRMEELSQALNSDTLETYWSKHKNDPVAGADTSSESNVGQTTN